MIKFKKPFALLSMTLFLFACNKEVNQPFVEELSPEIIPMVENGTFVSISKATDIAEAFFGSLSSSPATKSNYRISSTETIRDSKNGENPMMYVVNYADGGFVIVGATKEYYPVLAYSEKNSFVYNENIGGLVIWMEETKEAIRHCEALDEEAKTGIETMWNQYEFTGNVFVPDVKTKATTEQMNAFMARRVAIGNLNLGYATCSLEEAWNQGMGIFPDSQGAYDFFSSIAGSLGSPLECTMFGVRDTYTNQVGPLLSTDWHQYIPFNLLCPLRPDGHRYAGCVAVAMAQIMKFHGHPSQYNWNNMPDTPNDTTIQWYDSSQPNPDTPQLMADIGIAVDMDYFDPEGAAAKDINAKNAFQNVFGYNATIAAYDAGVVLQNIQFWKRPVYMSGEDINTGAGHAWVCDGAKQVIIAKQYFIEFLVGSPGSYNYVEHYDAPTLYTPQTMPGPVSTTNYFHMKWGEGVSDAWYLGNNASMGYYGTYQDNRWNIYVNPN